VALAVTSAVVPSDDVDRTVNWEEAPGAGTVPMTMTEVTVTAAGAVGVTGDPESPQAESPVRAAKQSV
jgi:hypothetical protein